MAFFEKVGGKVSEMGQSVVQKTGDMTEIMKLNAAIEEEERNIGEQYYEIGRLYAGLHRHDYKEAFAVMMTAIAASEQNIQAAKQQLQILKRVVYCTGCGAEMGIDQAFCSECGTKLSPAQDNPNLITCPFCQKTVDKNMRFCTGCGKPMEEILQSLAPAPEQTPVFAQLEGVNTCSNCGAVLEEGLAFCTQCGAIVGAAPAQPEQPAPAEEAAPSAVFCTACGAEVDPSMRFCTSCGKPMSEILEESKKAEEPSVAPAPQVEVPNDGKTCVKCGAVLEEGLAFCTQCGTIVAQAPATPVEEVEEIEAVEEVEEPAPVAEAVEEPASTTIRCTSCSAEIDRSMRFCTFCGKPMLEILEETKRAEEKAKAEAEAELAAKEAAKGPRKCPKCETVLVDGARFCSSCGLFVEPEQPMMKTKYCIQCGAEVDVKQNFCPNCGNTSFRK